MSSVKKMKINADSISFEGLLNLGICENVSSTVGFQRASHTLKDVIRRTSREDLSAAEIEVNAKCITFNGIMNLGLLSNVNSVVRSSNRNSSDGLWAENTVEDVEDHISSSDSFVSCSTHFEEATTNTAGRSGFTREQASQSGTIQSSSSEETGKPKNQKFETKRRFRTRVYSASRRTTTNSSSSEEKIVRNVLNKTRVNKLCGFKCRGRRRETSEETD